MPVLGALFGKVGCSIPIILILSTVVGIVVPVIIDYYIIERFEILKFLVLGEENIGK